jgi:hypothetical protein
MIACVNSGTIYWQADSRLRQRIPSAYGPFCSSIFDFHHWMFLIQKPPDRHIHREAYCGSTASAAGRERLTNV